MKYINMFREGNHVSEVYLCKNKQIQLTKNGKEYGNLVLQDKTGTWVLLESAILKPWITCT